MDGVMRVERGIVNRLLHIDRRPILARAWQLGDGSVRFRAVALDPAAAEHRSGDRARAPAGPAHLSEAIDRMRFAFGVDDDHSEFCREFKADPILGPAIRRRPWTRPRRRPFAWEALVWAITEQLIESERAAQIQRRMVRRWGSRFPLGDGRHLYDVPGPEVVAGRAPAELAGLDLAASRSQTLIAVAREVARGRADPANPDGDARLARISGVGPWTLQVLGQSGRGEVDSLPAGDLAYIKLVGRLAGIGRRATVEEVEEFFAPYAPYRGLAGIFALSHYHLGVRVGPPLRLAA